MAARPIRLIPLGGTGMVVLRQFTKSPRLRIQNHPNIAGTDPHTREGDAMQTKAYTVTGMTCAHCVNSVSTEIGKLGGVSDVQVDLSSGTVTVTSDQPLDDAAVHAAVDEAGYEVAR